MKRLGLLMFAAFFMFAMTFVPAHAVGTGIADATVTDTAKATGWLSFLGIPQKSDWLTYIGSDVGLTSAWSEYKICVPVSKDLPVEKRDVNSFNWYVTEARGKLKDWHFEILTNIQHNDKIIDYKIDCKNITVMDNKTLKENTTQECSSIESGWHWNNYTTQEWKHFEPVGSTFKAGACYNIRFAGSYAPAYGQGIRLDNVMQVAGNTYDEYTWWNADFIRKALITVTNPAAVQQKFIIPYDADMSNGFDDLRFSNAAEDTELTYWIDRHNTTNGTAATVWVNVLAAENIYVYYKNQSVVYDASDGQKTFEFFDDFNDNSINTTKWIVKGTNKVWEKNGYLAITGANAWLSGGVATNMKFDRTSNGYIFQWREGIPEKSAVNMYANVAYGDFTGTGNLQRVCNMDSTTSTSCFSIQYRNVSTSGWSDISTANTVSWNNVWRLYVNQTAGFIYALNNTNLKTNADNTKNNYNFTFEQYVSTSNSTTDDMLVAKLASPEPTYSIGAEQSPNTPPTWSANVSSIPTTYGTPAYFNVTWNDDQDSNGYNFSWFESNFSGAATNYTTARLNGGGNKSAWNGTLGVGTYYGKFWANDSSNAWNVTDTWTFTIGKASVPLTLANNLSWSGVYPSPSNTTGNGCTSPLTCELQRNGTTVTGDNDTLLGAGVYNYTWFTDGDANYSANSTAANLIITQGTNPVHLYLNSTADANATYTYPAGLSAMANNTAGTIYLYRDGVLKASGTSPQSENILLGVGTYAYKVNATGNDNYTDNATGETYYAIVNKASNPMTLTLNGFTNSNATLTYPAWLNATGYGMYPTLYRDGIDIASEDEYVLLGAGTHSYQVNSSGDANWSANATGLTYYAIISEGDNLLVMQTQPASTNNYPTPTYVNCTATNGVPTVARDGDTEYSSYSDDGWTSGTGLNHDNNWTTAAVILAVSPPGVLVTTVAYTNYTVSTNASIYAHYINLIADATCSYPASSVCSYEVGCLSDSPSNTGIISWNALSSMPSLSNLAVPNYCVNATGGVSISYITSSNHYAYAEDSTFTIYEQEPYEALDPGTYNYTCSIGDDGNYSANATSSALTITPFSLYTANCTSPALQLRLFDENTRLSMTGTVDGVDLAFSVGGMTAQYNSSFPAQNSTFDFCVTPPWAMFNATGTIGYNNNPTSPERYYFVDNLSISNSTQYIDLYLLNTTYGTQTTITFVTPSGTPLKDHQVIVQRYYPAISQYISVAAGITGSDGTVPMFLALYSTWYKFVVYEGGSVYYMTTPMMLSSTTITVTVNPSANLFAYWNTAGSVSGSCITINTSSNYTESCTGADSSGLVQSYTLLVKQLVGGTWIETCSNTVNASVGTAICNIGNNTANKLYWYSFSYAASPPVTLLSNFLNFLNTVVAYGNMGLFLTAMIVLTMILVGLWHPAVSIVLGIVGLFVSYGLGLMPPGALSALIYVTMAGMIVIWLLRS